MRSLQGKIFFKISMGSTLEYSLRQFENSGFIVHIDRNNCENTREVLLALKQEGANNGIMSARKKFGFESLFEKFSNIQKFIS